MHDKRITPLGESVCGGIAGGVTRFLVAPLDVVKVRSQLRGAEQAAPGVARLARAILREEGVRALWRGSGAGIALWVSFMAVQFPAYGACKRALRRAAPGAPAALLAAGAGAAAGAAATLATYPLDWARTQLASGSVGAAGGAWAALRPALAARGPGAWFAGVRPAVAAVLPSVALTFALHDALCGLWDGLGGVGGALAAAGAPPELAAQVRAAVCGGGAGLAAKLATHPLDTAKKLLQAQDAFRPPQLGAPHPRYRGALHALRSLAAGPAGARAWFRGLPPALYKAGASTALAFWAYEGAAKLLVRAGGPPFAAAAAGE
jgi:solute carrier family 25 thiamine pyrophosphate transporter 19